eukprot:4038741-Alexandrium_andersonii.AAC.1
MSASLVGSEMCIRDRRRPPPQLSEVAHEGWGEKSFPKRGWEELGSSEPVSYTHLTLPTICSV